MGSAIPFQAPRLQVASSLCTCRAQTPPHPAPLHQNTTSTLTHPPTHSPTHPPARPPNPCRYVQDEVSGVSERRQAISAALVVFALLVLLPMAPEVADTVGVGTPADFL